MSKILVTGGAGFIGSHLVERLLKENHNVIVLDDFSMGKTENLPNDRRLLIYEGSILTTKLKNYFQDVDIVFHLAALTRPQVSIIDPVRTNKTNVEGTLRVLKCAKEAKVKRVVFASSSSMYGDQIIYPIPESAPINTLSPYGLQKWIGEEYAKLYERMYGLEVNCIRPFNVYGTRQNPVGGYAAAVPKFIDALSKGETPFITGDGSQSRDFTYVGDLVDLFYKAAFSGVSGESFNGGGGVSIPINDLYQIIAKLMGSNTQPKYVEAVLEPFMTLADTSKAKRLLGWEPKTDIFEGLTLTIGGTIDGKVT